MNASSAADPDARAAAEDARALLTELRARPLLARLDAATARDAVGAPG